MLDKHWFSEASRGYAMSLRITRKLHEERSPHQKIAVYETTDFGHLLALDDITMLTSRDHFIYHEMMTHPALFTHPAPARVAIVGGGDCGALREVLRHGGVRQVTQVELDERVTRVAEQFFPELCEANDDERVTLRFADAVEWMKDADADSRELLILDTTDPVGQAGRLFAAPFYQDCHRVLCEGGILVAQSESPLLEPDILRKMWREMRKAGFGHMRLMLFPQVTYPSGWWSAIMARKARPLNDFREQAARHKPFPTRYYNADIHRSCSALPEFLREDLS